MKVSIIIPAYNESGIIEKNMRELEARCAERLSDFEIIIVSDGSKDGTWEIVQSKLAGEHIKDAGYITNKGKGGALRAGVLAADGEIIVTTDCDLAYGCDVIFDAVEAMKKNSCEILIGSRSRAKDGFNGYPLIRKLASKVYFKLIALYAGIDVSDSQCGFKCYKNDTAKLLFGELETYGFAFDLEILLKAKKHSIPIEEIPVTIKNHGASKINVLRDSARMLADVKKIKMLCAKGNKVK